MMKAFREMRRYLLLWMGQTVSSLGSGMTAFALIVWAYKMGGTVLSVALLGICSYVPKAVFSVAAGPIVDRLPKKAVMLAADAVAALATATVLFLAATGRLALWHLYPVNACLGAAGAFQSPASAVAVTMLTPRAHYMRANALQSFSDSLGGILTPVLATVALAFGGLNAVIAIDLATFAFAFLTLALFVRVPEPPSRDREEPFAARLRAGLGFLRDKAGIRHLVLYLALVNLVAGMAYYSALGPMVLARTGGDERILGWVNACIGVGMMAGALLVTASGRRGGLVKSMCVAYALSFLLCDMTLALGRHWWMWCLAAFLGNLPLPLGDAALATLLRENVPPDMQGRVFSVRNALTQLAITAGYLLGAWIADGAESALGGNALFGMILGTGDGRMMGVVFMLTSILGTAASMILWWDKPVRALETGR